MGTSATHYVVLGVAITKKEEVKDFFKKNEEIDYDISELYDDNGYKSEISENESGIHLIVDGMNGEYVVVGKILSKGIECDGIDFNSFELNTDLYKQIYPEILKLDKIFGTSFGLLKAKLYCFTHWH